MLSTCPVCARTVDYPERYAHKWHRCQGGCGPPATRLLLIPYGIARTEGEVEASWRDEARSARARCGAAAVALLPLVLTPLLAPKVGFEIPRVLSLCVAGVAAAGAAGLGHRAVTLEPARPPGL